MARTVLVTTGATVTFKALVDAVLDNRVLDVLVELQFDKLVVQFGTSHEARTYVESLLENKITLTESKTLRCGYKLQGKYKAVLDLELIPFDTDLVNNYIKECELVISHAGTGSIIDTLRCENAKLIVMVNTALKGNHQTEIANAFASLGVLETVASGSQLEAALRCFSAHTATPILTKPHGNIIGRIVATEITSL